MTGIAEFLAARYDEEQRLAEAATPGPWAVGGELLAPYLPRDFVHAPHYKPEGFSQGQHVGDASVADGGMGPWAVSVRGSGFPFANAQHIAAHDPARVLADIAAKRAIVAHYVYMLGDDLAEYLEPLLHMLAAPYATHPDFKPEWRIDA